MLHLAAYNSKDDIFQLVLEDDILSKEMKMALLRNTCGTSDKRTALHVAAIDGAVKIFQIFLGNEILTREDKVESLQRPGFAHYDVVEMANKGVTPLLEDFMKEKA